MIQEVKRTVWIQISLDKYQQIIINDSFNHVEHFYNSPHQSLVGDLLINLNRFSKISVSLCLGYIWFSNHVNRHESRKFASFIYCEIKR